MGRRSIAEFLGTFALVFAGTGAIVVDQVKPGAIGHGGVAATFGLIVMAMIYTVGDVSGAHLNPAVSVGFWLARRMDSRELFSYVPSQCLGAIAASVVLRLIFPGVADLGVTRPDGGVAAALVLEFVMTWLLMFVILGVSTGAREKGVIAGIAVGAVVALEALFGGPISGASMNPARSLAPALVSGQWAAAWIYLIAPIAGAAAGVHCCRFTKPAGCCSDGVCADVR